MVWVVGSVGCRVLGLVSVKFRFRGLGLGSVGLKV